MTVSVRKAAFGLLVTLIGLGVVIPLVFWLIINAIDAALNLPGIVPPPASIIIAAACALVGVFWASWAYSYLVFVGKGLPLEVFGRALHPTRILVTAGPYAYVRNPMMLGLLFLLLAGAFLARSISGLVLTPVAAGLMMVYVNTYEERGLISRFGDDYVEYRRNVPALLPRLTPYVHATTSAA